VQEIVNRKGAFIDGMFYGSFLWQTKKVPKVLKEVKEKSENKV